MKFSRRLSIVALVLLGVLGVGLAARAGMPAWIQNIDTRSALESVIFRRVSLPGGEVTIRRPPAETILALGTMIKSQPHPQDLYSLRALEEEQILDFTAAEADWKLYLQNSPVKAEAQLALADFYHRRNRPLEEVSALSAVGRMPALPGERLTALTDQASWKAFEHIFQVIHSQALAKNVAVEQYQAWIKRFPQERSVYSRYFEFLLTQKDFKTAQNLIAGYRSRFPADEVFLTKARALLAYEQGAMEQGLAVYDRNFQPLWPDELLKNYFDLLAETHNMRRFAEQARKALEQNPEDLNAATRIFHYYRQAGNLDAAEQSITAYRLKKESRDASWTAKELYTFARLLDRAHRYPEAARYYFALYNSPDQKAPEQALVGLAGILLTAPEEQIRFGAADLSMYRNIATMDTGPGYLNGILSLILNDTEPPQEFSKDEGRAVAYFHRARAAELVALLDQKFPACEARVNLHARLVEAYSTYGQDEAVIRLGREFLATFPQAGQRTEISLRVADVYELRNNTKEEFALYHALLKELANKAQGVPLGDDVAGIAKPQATDVNDDYHDPGHDEDVERWSEDDHTQSESDDDSSKPRVRGKAAMQAFSVSTQATDKQVGARSPEYERVLDRYLSRLAQQHAVPEALMVLRGELDRNPDDAGLYQRFAVFLEQNGLGTEQEAVYKRAIQKFSGIGWYGRLARLYLRHNRQDNFQQLTHQVAEIFSGTELQAYIEEVRTPALLTLAIEQYAHQRFPHNMAFVKELLGWYGNHGQTAEWEALLRQYWYEDQSLRSMFFEYLSRTGKLEAELEQLKPKNTGHEPSGLSPWLAVAKDNPAAARFVAGAELWRSHFEEAAPALGAVAGLYPADAEVGREASSVYRSLAYFNPSNTANAVRIEVNLQRANPLNRDTLARIGDIYADRSQFAQAAPYWKRMPQTEPGNPAAYEEAATVFWDYYMFDDALRLLERGRANLNDKTLYSYQAGAIFENKRDYPRAIREYVKGALEEAEAEAEAGESPSYKRLVQLAARHSTAAQVDAATAAAVLASGTEIQAIRLRADVLQAQSRMRELAPLLDSVVKRVESTEMLEQMDSLALQKSLSQVHCHILEREAAFSSDPVHKLQLQYALAGFYESHQDQAAANRVIDSVYRENPRVLGVVRTTVDFYWRNKQPHKAIQVLQRAAEAAHPELGKSLHYEAARKMTEAGEYGPARSVLVGLLEQSPYNGEFLASIADTYARAGDNAGLRDFYVTQITAFRQASLSAVDRKSRIAALRRGLIPAMTALKDFAGAVDQYIELVNGYPDDESITSEAALYAARHGRTTQIVNFYKKTVTDSPQDPRWMVVLARLESATEDHQGAIQAYSQAIAIRPDRPDLIIARANLEERLLRFDEAAADYATLYQRTYHDSTWMEKEAEVRARQNKPDLAVKALEAALVENRPKSPSAYFEAAERLERWGLLSEARTEVEKGVAAAGSDLLAGWENHSGARLYVRLSTRLRMQEAVFHTLEAGIQNAGFLPLWSRETRNKGMDAITDKEWRENVLNQRLNASRAGMEACMGEMGSTVRAYFTPEEKQEFLRFVEKKNAQMSRLDTLDYLVPLVKKAELAELHARLMLEASQAAPSATGRPNRYTRVGSIEDFADLQTRRLRLTELGQQLEQLASGGVNACSPQKMKCLTRAADVYHLDNKPEDELRVLGTAGHWSDLTPAQRQRYFELLLVQSPQMLVEWSSHDDERGNQSADFLLAHADARLARQAIDARGAAEPPVWKPAYTALAGLYFNDSSPHVKAAFQSALDDQSIGQRLRHGGDPERAITGDPWFYYASRYGEYLKIAHNGEADEFMLAELEHTPADADAYFDVADTFEQYQDWTRAVEDYRHALELSPGRVDAHSRLAGIYWKQKQRDAALEELRQALANLKKKLRSHRHTENDSDMPDFSEDYMEVAVQAEKMGELPRLRADLKEILHGYVKVHDFSGLWPMISATMAGHDPRVRTNLLLELSHSSREEVPFLEYFAGSRFESKLEAEPIMRRIVEIMRQKSHQTPGDSEDDSQFSLAEWELKWLESLLAARQYDHLRDEMRSAAKSSSDTIREALPSLQLRLAAATGNLDSALSVYRANSTQAPTGESLRGIAGKMDAAGDKRSAQKILEFVYQREIDEHQLSVSNMLGLAEIRIDRGDLPGGVELLRRMSLVAGVPFEAQDPAAALLVRTGYASEAIPFLEELVTAMPWSAEYRLRLAVARLKVTRDDQSARQQLQVIAADPKVAYETRVAAAKALAGSGKIDLGSRELNLLAAGGSPGLAQADQPFFFAARLSAASTSDGPSRIVLLRHALDEYPNADVARVPLLRAAMKAGDYHLAIAAMKPFLHNHWLQANSWLTYYYDASLDDADDADYDSPAEDVFAEGSEFEPDLEKLPADERAETCEQVGLAFQRLGALDEALFSFGQAAGQRPVPAIARRIRAETRALRRILQDKRADRERQPAIHDDLEQKSVVRPRLASARPQSGGIAMHGGRQ